MQKIALITDSTCGLPKEYVDKYNVHILRLKIIYKDREYIDGLDITPEEVYARLDEELPTTSMPSVQEANDLFGKLIEENYTHAVVLCVSSGLSGTINSFRLAAENYQDQIKSFVFDTKVLSMAVGLSVIEVGKAIEAGKSFEEICEEIPKLRARTQMYFTVDTLEYLIKGGRIGKVSGGIGEFLNLKPIITMDEDGKYTTYTKVRGTKQALNKLIALGKDILDTSKGKVVIMTGTMLKEAEMLKEAFESHGNTTFLYVGTITPVVGIHSGPRLLALAVMKD
ncbi:DegV family protein [Cellulosilyticum sp. I15G10I2]|uniref:DegV family protein n=1 Tax=Cellulosilyticum sp. I15G10I2 TaxID=1892843 RepID=UPI00085C76E8|nr:DegV family protein [Cellulosilyticum sp. I15G10I2]